MTVKSQAAHVQAVIGDGTNDSTGQLFTATTGSQNHPLDTTIFAEVYLRGGFVRLKPEAGDLWYLFSSENTATVDRAIVATAAGTTDPELGGHVAAGQEAHVFVPEGYERFVRESDSDDCTVRVELG